MEDRLIDYLRRRVLRQPSLEVGIGDDAAVLQQLSANCVVTTDMLMDQVDFVVSETDPKRIGRKALAVNLSDLAAMAAQPLAAFVSLALPRSGGLQLAVQLFEGMIPLADKYHVAIAGGDTNSWHGPLVISITAVGKVGPKGPLLRSNARPKDRILVTGSLGGSILGHHLDFEPRVNEALLLMERYELHAGIDISDGLSLDLWRMAQASGCGAVLVEEAIPISPDAIRLAADTANGRTPLDCALGNGEDFELLLAVPPEEANKIVQQQPLPVPVTDIGWFTEEPGLWLMDKSGKLNPLEPAGYRHRLS